MTATTANTGLSKTVPAKTVPANSMPANSMLFEGPGLEAVLNEARLCFGPDVEIEAANRVRRGGVFGFFASEWYEVWARPPSVATGNPALALLENDADADSFQRMLGEAAADPALESALESFFGDPTPTDPEVSRQIMAASVTTAVTTPTATPDAPAPAPTPAPVSAAVALEDAPRGATVFAPERAPKTDLLWAMLDRLDALPAAPPLPTDSGLVVFVGDAPTALETARKVGERHGLWNGDVAVLSRRDDLADVPSWLVINDHAELEGRLRRWRQRDGVVPVVLDQGVEAHDRAWAAEAITAMNADQVRLVVEAWRLTDDVGRLAGKLGGVDAIELVGVADSLEPLAALDLDIPLSSIEGRPATAELLAAVWLENRRRG